MSKPVAIICGLISFDGGKVEPTSRSKTTSSQIHKNVHSGIIILIIIKLCFMLLGTTLV